MIKRYFHSALNREIGALEQLDENSDYSRAVTLGYIQGAPTTAETPEEAFAKENSMLASLRKHAKI